MGSGFPTSYLKNQKWLYVSLEILVRTSLEKPCKTMTKTRFQDPTTKMTGSAHGNEAGDLIV